MDNPDLLETGLPNQGPEPGHPELAHSLPPPLTLPGRTLGQASAHQPLDYGHVGNVGCLALLHPPEPDP